MMQQKDSMAMVQYQHAAQEETNVLRRSKSYHNMGVIMQTIVNMPRQLNVIKWL